MYVCVCKAVTDRDIRDAVAEGATTLRDLRRTLGVSTGCGRCAPCARDVLEESKLLEGGTRSGFPAIAVPEPAL